MKIATMKLSKHFGDIVRKFSESSRKLDGILNKDPDKGHLINKNLKENLQWNVS